MSNRSFLLFSAWAAFVLSGSSARAAESDALAITASIQARHLPFGTILDPIFTLTDSDQIAGYTRCGDSALWTGHYLAAEAFRYKVTQAPDALNNVKAALGGLKSLADVTGTNLLARCLVPISSPYAAGISREEAGNAIYTNSAAGWIWVGHTSRDQYSGALFGLAVTYDMVSDDSIRSSISDLVTRLVDFLNGHNWSVVMPDGSTSTSFLLRPDQIETFLAIGRHVNADHFSSAGYETQRVLYSVSVPVPIGVDTADDNSYFKFNLGYINLYNLIRLESSSAKSIYQAAYSVLRNHTAPHQNAFFNVIDLGLNGPNAARDNQTLALLDGWLLRLRRDFAVDRHGVVPANTGVAASDHGFPVAEVALSTGQRGIGHYRIRGHRLHPALLDGTLLRSQRVHRGAVGGGARGSDSARFARLHLRPQPGIHHGTSHHAAAAAFARRRHRHGR
jgi:hypothetical protein